MYEIKNLFSKKKNFKPETLKAWIPLRCYRITLRHKLLSQLGKLSHFILLVLNEDNINFDQLYQVTNLTALQLVPLISRLEGLGLVKNKSLSPKGERLAKMLSALHDQPKTVWLDAHHDARNGTPPIMVLQTHSELDGYDTNDAIIKSWGASTNRGWSELDWVIDKNSQRKRLELDTNYPTYLSWLFPSVKEWIESENSPPFLTEWDIRIDIDEEKLNQSKGIPIDLMFKDNNISLEDKSRPVLSVASRVLQMELNYSLPEGLPTSFPMNGGEYSKMLRFCYLNNKLITETNPLEENTHLFKLAEVVTDEQAINEILKAVKTESSLLNREIKLKTLWILHHFYWDEVILQLKKSSTLCLEKV